MPRITLSSLFLGRLVACLTLLLAFGVAVVPPIAHAQSATDFESLEISLWPEFDRQAMLVIYRASLPATIPLPADVALPIPSGIQPNAVAQGETDGRLVDVDYTLVPEDGYALVQIQVTSQQVQVEYYENLPMAGTTRRFTFDWPGGVSVGSADLEVQNPPGVSDISLDPATTDELVGEYGLTYKRLNLGSLSPTDRPSVQVSYTKSNQDLTINSLQQAAPTSSAGAPVGSTPEPTRVVTWVVIALVVSVSALLSALYFRVWREPRQEQSAHRRHRPRSKSKRGAPAARQDRLAQGSVFCHVCGERAGPQDRFCRSCGTRLRN